MSRETAAFEKHRAVWTSPPEKKEKRILPTPGLEERTDRREASTDKVQPAPGVRELTTRRWTAQCCCCLRFLSLFFTYHFPFPATAVPFSELRYPTGRGRCVVKPSTENSSGSAERSPLKQKKALPKAGKRISAAADGASAAHARQRAARHCRRHRRQPGRGCGQHFHRAGRATVVQALGAVRFLAAGAGCAAAVRAARGLGGARSGAARRGAHT